MHAASLPSCSKAVRHVLLHSRHRACRLFGPTVLATTATAAALASLPAPGGDRARAFAFCANGGGAFFCLAALWRYGSGSVSNLLHPTAGVAVAMINFDPSSPARFVFDSALAGESHREYLLSPGGRRAAPGFKCPAFNPGHLGASLHFGAAAGM